MRVVATALMRAAPALIRNEQEVVLVRHRPRDGSNTKFERTTPMHVTSRKLLFLVTALVEAATGLCLLVVPAVLGREHSVAAALWNLDLGGDLVRASDDTRRVGRSDP